MSRLIEKIVVKSGFFLLKKASVFISKKDEELKEELKNFPEGFTIRLMVTEPFESFNSSLIVESGELKNIDLKNQKVDLEIRFKGLMTAFRIFLTLSTVHKSFVENKLLVFGDLARAMALIRILNIVQSYLYPPILSKRALKRPKKLDFNGEKTRVLLYVKGLLF